MLAIIPARGGSKGLIRKNIKDFLGKPLIAYTIKEALKTKAISRLIVSTEDAEIAEIAEKYGAEVPFMRPVELATDSSLGIDVLKYTIERLEKEEGIKISEFMVLQATSPLRTHDDIDNSIKLFRDKNADSVFGFCRELHPISWHKYLTEEGKFENIFEDKITNRQDERASYFPNGAIFIYKRELLDKRVFYTQNSYAYIMDRDRSVDIDTQSDFEYAEYLMNKRNKE